MSQQPQTYRLLHLASTALLVSAACAGTIAHANEQEMRMLVSGNTLLITNKYGPSHLYFDPSGVVLSRNSADHIDRARWRATEDSVCSISDPTPDGKTFPEHCMRFKGRQIGEEWTGDDPRNGKLSFKLMRGNVRNPQ